MVHLRDCLQAGASDSLEVKKLKRVVAKAGCDRAAAVKNVCRAFAVKRMEQLPAPIRAAARALIDS